VLNGIITPRLLTYILILANRSTVLGSAKDGPICKAVATLCVAEVGLLSFVVLVQTVFGLGCRCSPLHLTGFIAVIGANDVVP
jgi:Mn2+/Fe2+ NRAMP family transporter